MKAGKSRSPRELGLWFLVLIVIISAIYLLNVPNEITPASVGYSELRRLFMDEQVVSFRVRDNKVTAELRTNFGDSGSNFVEHNLMDLHIFHTDFSNYIDDSMRRDPNFNYDLDPGMRFPWWVSLLPYILLIAVMIFIWNAMMNRSGVSGDKGAMRFGKARTRVVDESKKKFTFADVAGAEEEKEELKEIVDFLKGPKKYIAIGARIPKGVLLVGPPGTGKTLIAKAVAGEAGVQFLSISGSDFVELYVGVGASRVRDLFEQAKKLAPAIIFIDEIDAVGRQRGAGLGGGHDEREQTLNQLLVEMDGFDTNEGVIILAATNRADILDNALLRPGRFDRQVYVGLPDIKGREEILKVHAKGKSIGEDVNLGDIAKGTIGFTGADLENLLNEAALLAARENKRFITMDDVEKATMKVIAGPEKKSRVVTPKSRKITAYHEAGHAIASFFLEHVDPVHMVTIIPRGAAGGMTVFRPQEDKDYTSRSEMFERIVSALSGRTAESLFLGDISTGSSGDINTASQIARAMVTRYGMSDKVGPISFDDSSRSVFIGRDFSQTKSYSEKTAATIDDEVKHIFDAALKKSEEILTKNKKLLVALVDYLTENETMDGEDFKYFCENKGKAPPKKPDPIIETSKPTDETPNVEFTGEAVNFDATVTDIPATDSSASDTNTVAPGVKATEKLETPDEYSDEPSDKTDK